MLLDRQTAVHLHGKGRKQRVIPLWKSTAAALRTWLDKIGPAPDAPVFPNRSGAPLTRSGHSSPAVTHQYLEANLAAKEAVLRRLADPSPASVRFHPGDRLLAFLQDL